MRQPQSRFYKRSTKSTKKLLLDQTPLGWWGCGRERERDGTVCGMQPCVEKAKAPYTGSKNSLWANMLVLNLQEGALVQQCTKREFGHVVPPASVLGRGEKLNQQAHSSKCRKWPFGGRRQRQQRVKLLMQDSACVGGSQKAKKLILCALQPFLVSKRAHVEIQKQNFLLFK